MTQGELARAWREHCARCGVAPEDLEWEPDGTPTKESVAKLQAALQRPAPRLPWKGMLRDAAWLALYALGGLLALHSLIGGIIADTGVVVVVALIVRARLRERAATVPHIVDGEVIWRWVQPAPYPK